MSKAGYGGNGELMPGRGGIIARAAVASCRSERTRQRACEIDNDNRATAITAAASGGGGGGGGSSSTCQLTWQWVAIALASKSLRQNSRDAETAIEAPARRASSRYSGKRMSINATGKQQRQKRRVVGVAEAAAAMAILAATGQLGTCPATAKFLVIAICLPAVVYAAFRHSS